MLGAAFFTAVRKNPFGGSLPQSAIDAINAIEAAWVASKGTSPDEFGYVLSTVFNECGPSMQAVSENLNYSAARMLEVWPSKFKTLMQASPYAHNPEKLGNHVYAGIIGNGDEASGDGYRFRGRGWPQLTGRGNYANFSQLIGVDLVANPDKLMQPAIGAQVLIVGMIEGQFTGKKLGDYFTSTKADAVNARAVVNGDVKTNGAKIAGYWKGFRAALAADPTPTAPPVPTTTPAPTTTVAPARKADPVMVAWQQLLIDTAKREGKPNPLPKYGADGFGGTETRDAIIAFQAAHPPLDQTGEFDLPTRTALNPPRPPVSINPLETVLIETALDAIIPPSPAKEMLMNFLPTIVQLIVSWLPGIPDDIKLVEAEIAEIASTDSGVKKLRTALVFAEALIDRIQAILDKVDPAGTIQPPASQVAVTKPTT